MNRKKSHAEFHESYQEHNCAIARNSDVIITDIKGTGWTANIYRAWLDLLLVSNMDVRSRVFYTSSNALCMERIRHFRKYKNKIHPFSKFRSFWDCMIFHVFLLKVMLFNINTSCIYGDMSSWTYYIVAAIEIVVMADIFVNLQTGVIDDDDRRVMLDSSHVALQYCTTKLFFHVSSAIPIQWIMFLRYGKDFNCSLCKFNKFTAALKLLNIISLARLYECSAYWTRERNSIKVTHVFKFLRISVLGFATLLEFNDLTDTAMISIFFETKESRKHPYGLALIVSKYILNEEPDSLSYRCFIYNVKRAIKALCLFSYHFSDFLNLQSMVIALTGYIISKMFLLWNIIEIYSYIVRVKYPADSLLVNRQMTLNHVKKQQLPDTFGKKIRRYYDLNMARYKINKTNILWTSLPRVLKEEIALITNGPYVMKIPYFSGWPNALIKQIVLALKEQIHYKLDLVVEAHQRGDGLYIVQHGELAVYTNNEETGHLIDGDYFGEVSLVTDKEIRTSSVIAVTPSLILFLNKIEFRRVMRSNPELFHMTKLKLKAKYNKSNDD